MKPHAPRPAFLLLPPDPEGHTRPETLLSLSVIEQVRWLPGEGDTPAQLQIDPLTTARSRSHQVLMGKEAEALWAQLLMLNKAEWRGVQLAAQAPGLREGLGQALALMNGAAVEPAEERAAVAAAPGAGAALGQQSVMSAAPDNNLFHDHLNDCRQCWETTFALSDTGALFLGLSLATASAGETAALRRAVLNLALFAVGGSDACFLEAAAEVNARGRAMMTATKQAEVSMLREGSQP